MILIPELSIIKSLCAFKTSLLIEHFIALRAVKVQPCLFAEGEEVTPLPRAYVKISLTPTGVIVQVCTWPPTW